MMKILLLIIILFSVNINAQSPLYFIVGNNLDTLFSYDDEFVIITNQNSNTEFSGVIMFSSNDGGVRIIPQNNYKVIIKPHTKQNKTLKELEIDGTVIGSREKKGDNKDYSSVTISPIPTDRYLNIYVNTELCKYAIYDTNGNLKIQKSITCTKSLQLDVSYLTKGNYILSLENKNSKNITKYFIKN